MAKIGLFFGSNDGATKEVASMIANMIGNDKVEIYDVKEAKKEDLTSYNKLILLASTHGKGILQKDFSAFLQNFSDSDFAGKTIALAGLGGQIKHADTFCDGLKELKEKVSKAKVVGYGSTDDFKFEHSKALENGKFIGLCLDHQNQPEKTETRIKNWLELIKADFSL